MWVRELDVFDDDQVREYWTAGKEGDEFGRPFAAYRSLEALLAALREEATHLKLVTLVAGDDDGVAGIGEVGLPLHDNTHLAYVEIIVRPTYRRRGFGTALLDASLQAAREHGRHTAISETNMPLESPAESPGRQFLERHGFTTASTDIHRVLTLPAPSDLLDRLERHVQERMAGYSLVSFTDRVPDDLVDGYCSLQSAFNSLAPIGELDLEPEVWDEARVRANEGRGARMGRRSQGTVALDSAGAVVGLTEMFTNRHLPALGWQSGTLVLPDHRGHRLGLAIKLANLRSFQQNFPAVTAVHSWNAEQNGPMVAINDTLGFRPVEYVAEMQRRLD
jgi:GNAT superfamily N-acetyltransferase